MVGIDESEHVVVDGLTDSPATIASVEQNLWSMWSQFGQGPGCALHDAGGLTWFETPIAVLPYNMVMRCQADSHAHETIARIFARFRRRAVPFVWFVHPSARPADLEALLERQGFEAVEAVTGMAMSLVNALPLPRVPRGVDVRLVTPSSDLILFTEFVAARWQIPLEARPHLTLIADTFRIGAADSPNRAWIAIKDGMAIAKVFTHTVGDVVGIYGMATRQGWRGLGLGRALCLTALADARARGCRLAVLHSSPMAVPLYRGVGFREAGRFSLFAEPDSFYA